MKPMDCRANLTKRMFLSFGAAGAFALATLFSGRHGLMGWLTLAPAILWLIVGLKLHRKLKAASPA